MIIHATEAGPCSRRAQLSECPCSTPIATPAHEEHNRRGDEQRREQPHLDLRRALQPVRLVSRVVPGEAPARARELQHHGRDQDEADEDMQGKELTQAEHDRSELDQRQDDQDEPHRCRQTLVPVRIELAAHASKRVHHRRSIRDA